MASKKKKMGRPPGRMFDTSINMRLDGETAERLQALADKVSASGMGRSSIARACLLAGLDLAEKDPGRVLLGVKGR